MVCFLNIWASYDVSLEFHFFKIFRDGPYGCTLSLREQEALSDVFEVSVASGVAFQIFGDAIQRFHGTVGKPCQVVAILAVFFNNNKRINDLIEVFFQSVGDIFVKDLLIRVPVVLDHSTKAIRSFFGFPDITIIESDEDLFQIAEFLEHGVYLEQRLLIIQSGHVTAHPVIVVRLGLVFDVRIVLCDEPVVVLDDVVIA